MIHENPKCPMFYYPLSVRTQNGYFGDWKKYFISSSCSILGCLDLGISRHVHLDVWECCVSVCIISHWMDTKLICIIERRLQRVPNVWSFRGITLLVRPQVVRQYQNHLVALYGLGVLDIILVLIMRTSCLWVREF